RPIRYSHRVKGYLRRVLPGGNCPVGERLMSTFGINLIFTWQGAVLAATVVAFPLTFKSARAAFEVVDPQYEQAARVLRVGELAIFFRVTLPLAWAAILAGRCWPSGGRPAGSGRRRWWPGGTRARRRPSPSV